MSLEPHVTFLARLARRPFPIFLGIVVGFVACCLAGRLAAKQQPFEDFVRFHAYRSPEVNYYPSFSRVLNLAREHIHPGKILVVVGGNSILHGVGQRESQVWTRHLQEQLGDRFEVLNLALKGNDPFELGGLVAERLVSEGAPVIFVTSALDGNIDTGAGGEWEGRLYQYFFWDAWGKGLVPSDERRDQWLNDDASRKPYGGRNRLELRYCGLIDGVTYADDLWNDVAYRYLCSVWSPLKYPKFWEAYRKLPDPDPGDTLPFDHFNNEAYVPISHKIMLAWIHTPLADGLLRGDSDERVARIHRRFVPAALQHRTLYVFRSEGVYYLKRLPPDEQARYRAVVHRLPQAINGEDLRVQVVGENYTERDYYDRSHFSEQGGRKVAIDLAPSIRSIAEKLYGASNANLPGGKP
jgi:hypothetical protein